MTAKGRCRMFACLSLSIWTPAKTASERLPVMVWIHGGGFFSGSHDEGRHEGSVLASNGVVVVEINYRLGVMGFLAHPELTAESGRKASGNYGLMDQIAALRWVKQNIGAFGGDANNVTIFGESAGSFAVSALVASPHTDGLFHKAIGESGAYFGGPLPLLTLAASEKNGADLAATLGATSLATLRQRTPAELVKTIGSASTRFVPTIDGDLNGDPWDTYAAGRQRHVPLMAGWNSAEIKSPPTGAANFTALVRKQLPNDADAALKVYPAATDEEASRSAVAFASDNFIGYNTWKWIDTHATTGGARVYRYLFDQIVPTPTGPPPANDPGAGHASEIEFVFRTLESRKLDWRPVDRAVSDLMVAAVSSCASTA